MSKKKPFLAALIAGTGALLLLMQSGYLPGLRRRLREKKAACCKTAEVASAYVVRKSRPWGKRLWETLTAALPLLLSCMGTAMLAASRLLKRREPADKGE